MSPRFLQGKREQGIVRPARGTAEEGSMRWGPEHEARWQQLSEEVTTGRRDWRAAHPRATFAEIEAVVDERLNGMRARRARPGGLGSRRPAGWTLACPRDVFVGALPGLARK